MRFKSLFICVFIFSLLSPLAALADVCVWRDPERTMTKLFTDAQDYLTVDRKLDAASIAAIEKILGEPLEETEKKEYSFYEIRAGKRSLGWVMALAGTGEYGTIETVVGVNPDGTLRGVYLQRIRERQREELSSDAFLNQFKGKTLRDDFTVKAVPGAETASREISRLVKKMLAFHAALNPQPSEGDQP